MLIKKNEIQFICFEMADGIARHGMHDILYLIKFPTMFNSKVHLDNTQVKPGGKRLTHKSIKIE